jgi:arginyl-tRNA synthetase
MKQMAEESHGDAMPKESDDFTVKMDFLGKAYALGSSAFENATQQFSSEAKEEIVAINEKIYNESDDEINKLYDAGREWSLAYFETVYQRLGTKFDHYFFE